MGRAIVGTVSGTAVSYGSEYTFNAASTNYISITTLDSTHFAVAYQDSNGYGNAVVGTVSDTAISFGSEYTFNAASTTYVSASALDATHVAIAYRDSDGYGRAIVGTVADSVLTYGSEYAFNEAATTYISIDRYSSTQFLTTYTDGGNSSYGTLIVGTVAGDVISYDEEAAFSSTTTSLNAVAALSSVQFITGYKNDTTAMGMAIVGGADSSPPVPSSFSPASGSTISDTTQTITFTTDESATCYLSLDGDEAYAAMSDDTLCSGGGTTSQSCTTPDLGSDGAKAVYIACTDGTNADTADTNEELSYTLDTTAPTISAVSASATDDSATITWTTNESGSSIVQYGTTAALGYATSETDTSPRVTAHEVELSSLPACTTYHYRPISTDASSNTTTGSTVSFTTTGCTNSATVQSQTGSTVTTVGGSLDMSTNGSGVTLDVPANSVTNTFTLQIKKIDKATVIALTSTPSGTAVIGDHTYDFRAISGSTLVTSFLQPITVTMEYTAAQVSGYDESSLWIHRWDGSDWHALDGCAVDTTANTVTCTTTNFSTFGLFGDAVTVSSTDTSVSTTASTQSTGGRRGSSSGMAERISTAQNMILARYQKERLQEIAIGHEPQHAAAEEEPAASVFGEERRIQSATQKSMVVVVSPSVTTIAQQRGRLYAVIEETAVLYRDVPTDAWFTPYVAMLIEENIAQGYKDETGKPKGEFGVANPITYTEVLKMTLESAEYDVAGLPPPRNVSARGSWANAYTAKAEELGLTVFTPDRDVHTPATRGEVVHTILEVLKLPIAKQVAQFSDVPRSHPYANAIATAAFFGFITGDTDSQGNKLNTFRPDAQINRAEVAKIIALMKAAIK